MTRKRLSEDPYLERLIAAMNEAAHSARTTLLATLVLSTSLLALALSATHEALFRDEARLIPQLGVNLPLKESFGVAPVFFIFAHAMLAVQLRALRDKARHFQSEIKYAPARERERLRQLIFPFSYLLGFTDPGNKAAKLVSAIGIYVTPPALLFAVSLRFLPYRDGVITSIHMAAWVADMAITLWLLGGGDLFRRFITLPLWVMVTLLVPGWFGLAWLFPDGTIPENLTALMQHYPEP